MDISLKKYIEGIDPIISIAAVTAILYEPVHIRRTLPPLYDEMRKRPGFKFISFESSVDGEYLPSNLDLNTDTDR